MSKGAETRERILDRAYKLASRDGLAGLSIGKLAGDLGLSKSGLFAHFGSKEELEIELLKAAAEEFTSAVVLPALKAPRGLPRLRALFTGWQRWLTDPARPGGCVFFQAGVELDDSDSPVRQYVVEMFRRLHATLAKAARLAVEEGHLRRDVDGEQLAFELHGIMMEYHHARRLMRDPKAEARAKSALERLLASYAAPEA